MSEEYPIRAFGGHLGGLIEVRPHGNYRLVKSVENEAKVADLQMQHGGTDPNGFTIEDLLNIVVDRINEYNDVIPDALNMGAITMIRQAQLNLKRREDLRKARQAVAEKAAEPADK